MLLLFDWFAEDVEKRKKKPTHFSRRVGNVLAKSKERSSCCCVFGFVSQNSLIGGTCKILFQKYCKLLNAVWPNSPAKFCYVY